MNNGLQSDVTGVIGEEAKRRSNREPRSRRVRRPPEYLKEYVVDYRPGNFLIYLKDSC